MPPDFNPSAVDFDDQLGACVNALGRDDAFGQILVFNRVGRTLQMRQVTIEELTHTDIAAYEMVMFDASHTSTDTWKHLFFPRQRAHCFVYDA
ncbi:TPA: uridylate kinase [Pseudomonas aeruginosa]|nr:uridylate kinase [Pseudomonas aeruginosa]